MNYNTLGYEIIVVFTKQKSYLLIWKSYYNLRSAAFTFPYHLFQTSLDFYLSLEPFQWQKFEIL